MSRLSAALKSLKENRNCLVPFLTIEQAVLTEVKIFNFNMIRRNHPVWRESELRSDSKTA